MLKSNKLIEELEKLFPDAKCELNYTNTFELLIAVVLSAQTTDRRVNMVTRKLFTVYPDVYRLASAAQVDVENIISSLGLFRTKAENIIALSKKIVTNFGGEVPNTLEDLTTLPGVGRKSANVVLSEGFGIPAIAVDTHVARVSNRLGLVDSDDTYVIEKTLEEYFPKDDWHKGHNLLVHFGRYFCTAQKPNCLECPFNKVCPYYNKK
ncbi:MAG TPA: endonuclease III [Acholeplasmataceae bacterium]|nr:endonuclease III [Acholeplasmataceae bacterium]